MNNLIIIGNGFDLAHGLETSYRDFMSYLVDNHCKDRTFCSEIFKLHDEIDSFDKLIEMSLNDTTNSFHDGILDSCINIRIVKIILTHFCKYNWSDLEQIYFDELKKVSANQSYYYHSVKDLNEDFEILKGYLKKYLLTQQSKGRTIEAYEYFFSKILNPNSVILNFNYTDTIERLYEASTLKNTILHIHGKLNDPVNPVIFGYAADYKEIKSLVAKNDNEYLRNIKRNEYKRTDNENLLAHFLDKSEEIRVFVLGHSCGVSDKLILEQILNHKNIHSIRILFHKEYENYFQIHTNAYRIIQNDDNYKKINNFLDCCKMPQFNDESPSEDLDVFTDKIAEEYNLLHPDIPPVFFR